VSHLKKQGPFVRNFVGNFVNQPTLSTNFVGNFVDKVVTSIDKSSVLKRRYQMFRLDDLKVYQKALPLAASAERLSSSWGKRHVIVDHFRRAAESIVLNIAAGARFQSGPEKAKMADVALGSTFECAACLDIAMLKGLLPVETCASEKARFLEITRMLVGLRRGWLPTVMKEEPHSDSPEKNSSSDNQTVFHHETLDVYKVALEFVRWLVGVSGSWELSERLWREIDKGATSVVLNVAEGNGRYSELDHRRFFDIAATSAAKTTAYLDLYEQKTSTALDTRPGKEFLSRIIAMLTGF
jgi:four helix bundle protein